MTDRIKMGDTVKDKITGYTGVVVSKHEYLHGCLRLGVMSKTLHEGRPVDGVIFDEPQLDIVEEANLAPKTGREPGGPRDDPYSRSVPSR